MRRTWWLLGPLCLALFAIPSMGPGCTGGSSGTGLRQFTAGSLIIPMDECYQRDNALATLPRPAARRVRDALLTWTRCLSATALALGRAAVSAVSAGRRLGSYGHMAPGWKIQGCAPRCLRASVPPR